MRGRLHSIQTLGTLDGPGVRFVAFLQGCPLRCGCCHNPDTWDVHGGEEWTAAELVTRAERYRAYFGAEGGITLSGGEPLLQAAFAAEVFSLCRAAGIHTCLDTSGCFWNEAVERLLSVTDRVLLDIKYADDAGYLTHVGCDRQKPLFFLEQLQSRHIPTTIRRVIIPSLNDDDASEQELCTLVSAHDCIDTVELLPFKKLCTVKYEEMGLPFPMADIPEPSHAAVAAMQGRVSRFIVS